MGPTEIIIGEPERHGGGVGKPRLSEATEQVLREAIAETHHAAPRKSAAETFVLIEDQCRVRHLPPPSVSTIRRRLRPVKPADQAFGTAQSQPQVGSSFAAVRQETTHSPVPSETDAPQLSRVAQLNQQLARLETRAIPAELALDRLATAVIVVNRFGHVVHLNVAAEQIVAAGDYLSITNRKLTAASRDETQHLLRLVAGVLESSRSSEAVPGVAMRISRRSAQAPYETLVTPLSNSTFSVDLSGPLAGVFVRNPKAQVTAPTDRRWRLYALTEAEARLMQALLAGETLDVAANRFGVGKETLRSQLKSIFLKTGTRSQIELLRLGLRGLAAFEV